MQDMTTAQLAKHIEHTLLKPEATPDRIDALCDEALLHGFLAVCVQPCYVGRAAERLGASTRDSVSGQRPFVVSVAGFPLGGSRSDTKADEARRALDDGAREIDMVVALGALIAGDRDAVRDDILTVAHAVHSRNGILKVILETAALTEAQVILGCRLCAEGEADFVKTSTGLHATGGARADHVRLLHRHAAPMRVKAAGGIRTADAALAMLAAGAVRIGTSSSVDIVRSIAQRSA